LKVEDKQQQFLKILSGLNSDQSKAVNKVEGPVLVLAGPGTGKTHILAARIGKILMETDALPHNILCLTFTEAGVLAMRKRLIDFIGPDAHKINIHTFHSFSNRVIRENLEYFGRQNLEPVSELELMNILQELINEQAVDHPLRKGRGSDIYFYTSHLKSLFSMMKAEDWTPEIVVSKAKDYLDDLPNREEYIYKRNGKGYKKGDLKQASIEKEEQAMEKLVAGAKLFPRFLELMDKYQRYDYNDMILWTINAFQKNEWLLRSYQEQFLYVLVDEFQDTNGAQNEILQMLISYWDSPNLFIVGDDDQSIYEFQGARLKNLTDYYFKFKDEVELIVLKNNYRSTQGILDASKNLIEYNTLRIVNTLGGLEVQKELVAENPVLKKMNTVPVIRQYPYEFHELAHIVSELKDLKQSGYPLEEVAILYAKHRQSEDLVQLLDSSSIPFQIKRKTNILEVKLVKKILEILSYLREEIRLPYSGEHRLFKILHYKNWNLSSHALAKLALFLAKKREETRLNWRDVLQDENLLKEAGIAETSNFLKAGACFNQLIGLIENESLPHLVEAVLTRTGILAQAMVDKDKIWKIQVLYTFLDFIKNEVSKVPEIELAGILDVIQDMDRHKIGLDLEKDIGNENGVNLMTAHGSKGLEFKRVYILNCSADFWEPGKSGNNFRFKIPDTLTYSGEEDALEARRRLFYVAMTRAKEDLYLGYSLKKNETKEIRRAIYLDELNEDAEIQLTFPEVDEGELLIAKATLLQEPETEGKDTFTKDELNALLEDFQLTISSFNQYLECPRAFFYETVLNLPSLYSEAASYGSVMHRTMQHVFESMLKSKEKEFPGLEDVLTFFEKEMMRWKGYFSTTGFEQRLKSGLFHLKEIYQQWLPEWSKQVKLEFRITQTEINEVPVSGIIDKVSWEGQGAVCLVDYKTGKPKSENTQKPTAKKPYGGKYWRQLLFYQLLVKSDFRINGKSFFGRIAYLEPDENGTYLKEDIHFSPQEEEEMASWIKEVYQKIMGHQFSPGCQKETCEWCNFETEQSMPDSLSSRMREEMDDH
jgi:DNA helicase-2/ATP-dependent DNA helicase PcrA